MIPSFSTSIASRVLLFGGLMSAARAQQITTTQIATFQDLPTSVTAPRGDTHRLFVVLRSGRIRILRDGVLLAAPFLDITPEIMNGLDGGLLGLEFHPDFAANGRFFVSFTAAPGPTPRLREYRVSGDPDLADPASGVDVFAHPDFQGQAHFGADLHFGPDGMLYYSLGMGATPDLVQRFGTYTGKLLRIDVDVPPPHVPIDNPYAAQGDGALDLIWARGFRSPWRFSFDRSTGDLYLGDVGHHLQEEIDFQPANSGAPGIPGYQGGRNYGFPCMEGGLCFAAGICACDPAGNTLVLPVFEWPHGGPNSAAIGGFVYRGSAIPGLQGRYFCADYSKNQVWTFVMANGRATDVRDLSTQLRVGLPGGPNKIVSFGEDANGELYVMCEDVGSPGPSAVFRIDPATSSCTAPVTYCGTNPNSTGFRTILNWSGSGSIGSDDLVLVASQAPPNALGTFRCGTHEVQQPLGNGWNCVGGNVVRLPYVRADAHGDAVQQVDYSRIAVIPGQTRAFQFLHRDPAGGGASFNLSSGLRVVFCP